MKRKILLIICIILFVYFSGGIIYNFIRKEDSVVEKKEDYITIKGYNYLLSENDSDIYKEEFNKLKNNLESENIDYKEYAESISKLFLIDLYSLDNKKNKYDVGGVEFVYPEIVDNYKLNVEDTLYRYMIDNSSGKREQDLPMVKNVIVKDTKDTKFKIKDNELDGYKITLDIEYEEDLGYDNKAEIIVVKEDKLLYIVEKN